MDHEKESLSFPGLPSERDRDALGEPRLKAIREAILG